MYSLPQEIEVWYILPAIRRGMAEAFVRNHNMSYEKAGNILGISKAAVSQYLSNKRATKVKLKEDVKREIDKSAEIASKNPKKAIKEIQRILKYMRDKKYACEICKKYNPQIKGVCEGEHSC